MMEKTTWDILSNIDCSKHVEKKNGKSYLSWAWAWGIVKANFPDTNYYVREWGGIPYLADERLGIIVETSVTIQGETISMRLPVMDSSNNAMKLNPYTYSVKEYKGGNWTGNYIDKEVEAATMFDINTAIMRCLTKNLALFGLGHYIYTGEDLPVELNIEKQEEEKAKFNSMLESALSQVKECKDIHELETIWKSHIELQSNSTFKLEVVKLKKELSNGVVRS